MNIKEIVLKGFIASVYAIALGDIIKSTQKKKQMYKDCKRMADIIKERNKILKEFEEQNSQKKEDERIEFEDSESYERYTKLFEEFKEISEKYRKVTIKTNE